MEAKTLARWILGACLAGGSLLTTNALAEELSLERYIQLSIARLELSKQSWSADNLPPSREAMATLFAEYGISETGYLAYTNANRDVIDAYLAAHPDVAQQIERLSADIDSAITE